MRWNVVVGGVVVGGVVVVVVCVVVVGGGVVVVVGVGVGVARHGCLRGIDSMFCDCPN